MCGRGGTGRRARLRCVWLTPWEFESPRPHHSLSPIGARRLVSDNKPMGTHFSITDLAREFAVTNRAIRFYEDEGLISPERDGQRRVYSQRDRIRLMLILRGRRLGFSLKEIREIIDLYDADPNEVAQLRHFLAKIRERRDQLRSQQDDIQAILTELDNIESQCDSLLKAKQQ